MRREWVFRIARRNAAAFRRGIGATWIGAVGEQRHHRIGTAFEAVARGRDQWRQAGVRAIEIGAFRDQAAQQAHVGADARQFDHRALIAIARWRNAVRVGAAIERSECELRLSGTHASQEHRVEFFAGHVLEDRFLLLAGPVVASTPFPYACHDGACIDEHGIRRSVEDDEACGRHETCAYTASAAIRAVPKSRRNPPPRQRRPRESTN